MVSIKPNIIISTHYFSGLNFKKIRSGGALVSKHFCDYENILCPQMWKTENLQTLHRK